MKNNEYLKVLNNAFSDFKFYPEDHHYEHKGQRVGISVTRLIEKYTNEFDSQTIAEKVAEKNKKNYEYAKTQLQLYNPLELNTNNCMKQYEELQQMLKQPLTIQEVLNEWKYKNQFARNKGTNGHNFAQSLWNGELYHEIEFDLSEGFKMANNAIYNQAKNFYNDFSSKLEHLADEFVVGSEEYDIASAIDHLFINKLTGRLVLIDYKTNSDIHKSEKYAKNMKIPLNNLKDFTLNHYYIQLSIYKFLIEKYTGLVIDEMFIVWFSENNENYEIIEIPYLKDEVEDILEIRRVKNMKSIPVLIMGASGTGKSYSFKNLPPEETAIISVAKSELPFRNKTKLKFVECDDYAKIEKAIQSTKKRIICLDDTGYLMQFENFDKAMIKGYDKHTEMAKHYADLLKVIRKLDGEKIVYMTIHEDIIDGIAKPKTTGKMINDNLCIEGLLNIVFRSVIKEGEHVFQTRSAGDSVAKTPDEMYEEEFIPNDLAEIDKTIREYYEFKPITEKLEEAKVEE